jgi:membrane protein
LDHTTANSPRTPKTSGVARLRKYGARAHDLLGKEIWELEHLGRRSARARLYLVLRILSLTWQGLRRNKIPVQSAALTFYSLIGIGPLIALGIMISGFVMDQTPTEISGTEQPAENIAMEAISTAIAFAAPQLSLGVDEANTSASGLAPEMTEMINSFITAAQSGTVGVVGTLMLFVIGIKVLTSIEGCFNSLWGVGQGRKLGERIVVYWTFISLGAVIGAASLSLLTLRAVSSIMEKIPFGGQFLAILIFLTPVIAFLLITFLLTLFFRFIPNTQVKWKPAFTGAALVVALLHLYNMLSFLYVQRVVDTRSLYGSVGIVVVLMLGLYVFWLLILLGGQVTYAIQNADYLTNENAWQNTSERTREVVSLAVLLLVAKRFQQNEPPIRASELYKKLRVPSHIMNSSINRLCEIGYLYPVEAKTVEDERDRSYHPGLPLESITLGKFKQAFECHGNNEGAELVSNIDPAIRTYLDEIISLKSCPQAKLRLSDLIGEPQT